MAINELTQTIDNAQKLTQRLKRLIAPAPGNGRRGPAIEIIEQLERELQHAFKLHANGM